MPCFRAFPGGKRRHLFSRLSEYPGNSMPYIGKPGYPSRHSLPFALGNDYPLLTASAQKVLIFTDSRHLPENIRNCADALLCCLNPQETIAVQRKLEERKARFDTWLWLDEGRTEPLAQIYNSHFNVFVGLHVVCRERCSEQERAPVAGRVNSLIQSSWGNRAR